MATDARSANRNYPVPHADNLISEDFPRLITALGMIDTDVDSLFTSMAGKASASHTHAIGDIDGLQDALDGKAAAGHTHALGDLNNVSTGGAGSGQYLGFTGSGWQPITIQISHVSGLQGALDGKADASSLGTAALVNTGTASGEVPTNGDLSAASIPFDDTTAQLGETDVQGAIGALAAPARVDVASAATTNIGAADSLDIRITDTVTITAFDTAAEGVRRNALFAASLTLTHNATSLINLTGADITTAAGDIAVFVSEGSGNWRMVDYVRADGTALVASLAAPKARIRASNLPGTPVVNVEYNGGIGAISLSRTGTGQYTVSWSNALTNPQVIGQVNQQGRVFECAINPTSTSQDITILNPDTGNADPLAGREMLILIYGEL